MLKIKVEKFEGPLDLLLELIEKEKLDITEISLSKITDQYLTRVSALDPKVYDVTEFMLIAARLIYLKSKVLLPTLETQEEEEELEDLKERLEIYKKYKDAAKEFGSILERNQRSFPAKKPQINLARFVPPKGVELTDLWSTFQKLLTDMPEEIAREEVEIPSEKITVEERLAHLHQIFKSKKRQSFKKILSNSNSKIEAIITFLAVLEMVKCKKIKVSQGKNFDDINLEWNTA
ncbi:MAG: segregation/condensation protein A [Patescibacteria group bacterium]|nr:segregation/condensation protein A [Patescibacteria group bacterium]